MDRRMRPLAFLTMAFASLAIDFLIPASFYAGIGRTNALLLELALVALSVIFFGLYYAYRGRNF